MYPLHHFQQPYGLFSSRQYQQQTPQLMHKRQGFYNTQLSSISSELVTHHCNIINEKANFISSLELTNLLDELLNEYNSFRDEKQQLTNLKDIITVLSDVRPLILAAIAQHKFFDLLRIPLIQILQHWNKASSLDEDELFIFRSTNKLLKPILREVMNTNHYPSWLTDSSLLNTIAVCFTDILKSGKFFDKKNQRIVKNFTRLLDVYYDYQKLLDQEKTTDQDKLVQLLDPVIDCLTSNLYLDSFDHIHISTHHASKKEKSFLIRCPTFLTSYNGSRLEQTMINLLSTMLPKYTILFDKLVPSAHQWKRPILRAVNQLLRIVNHGSGNTKILSNHLPFIDHILKIIDISTFHDKLQPKLSNPQTNLINTGVSLLVNMINEPTILTHIKQQKVTSSFLRLTSAQYKPLVYNIYTLLAYTTSEEDIKSMHNPGILLSTVIEALKTAIDTKSDNQNRIVQLLETLKGLVQHDQLKEEILKQNILSFLLNCSNKLTQTPLILLLEILWSLSFSHDIARTLRDNSELLEKVQTTSKNTNNEALKKAADGLVWKLIREPAFLDKVAHQEEEEADTIEEITTKRVIIGEDGKERVVTTTKRSSIASAERVFQYDIMISYCHADKDLIIKIHKFLVSQGFKIWIDLDNMFGPAMNAMAEAVENSEFVLLSMSDSYKQSTYCQAEAEYAFNCKRRLVPLIVRPGYKADGWLGFMIGSRIYVDYGSFDFDTACEKLMNEISRQRKRPLPSKLAQVVQPEKPVTTAPTLQMPDEPSSKKSAMSSHTLPDLYMKRKAALDFNKKYIDRWMESDVLDFLFSNLLNELMPLCEKMDGPTLIQLYKMCTSGHNRTYTILNDQLKTTHETILPIGTYVRFLSIMERVVKPPLQPRPMLLPPLQSRPMLPPPQPPPIPFQQVVTKPPVQDSNAAYDILITSNAPILQMLRMVENVGSRWQLRNSA